MNRNILVSFSGGRTSAYMAQRIKKEWANDNLLFVFANTGRENEETLLFADKVDKHFGLGLVWVEALVGEKGTKHTIVDYELASRNGEPFEAVIQKYGLPNKSYPHCTRELKIQPIHSFAKEYFDGGDYLTAIGIRMDEFDRMTSNPKMIYPLVKWCVTKQIISDYWANQPFDLNLKAHQGNCDCCWKKSIKKLRMIASESPAKFDWWIAMEDKYGAFVPSGQVNRPEGSTFFRGHLRAIDIISMAKNGHSGQLDLFEIESPNGCEESCEIF